MNHDTVVLVLHLLGDLSGNNQEQSVHDSTNSQNIFLVYQVDRGRKDDPRFDTDAQVVLVFHVYEVVLPIAHVLCCSSHSHAISVHFIVIISITNDIEDQLLNLPW